MGSLRTLQGGDSLVILDKHVRKSHPVHLIYRDEHGYMYSWTQGPFIFHLNVVLDRDEETLDWKGTTLRVSAETKIPPDPGDTCCSYYLVRDFFEKSLPEVALLYEYAGEVKKWGIEREGIFALLRIHPDFPYKWKIKPPTEKISSTKEHL
jgi:hypothetical protein